MGWPRRDAGGAAWAKPGQPAGDTKAPAIGRHFAEDSSCVGDQGVLQVLLLGGSSIYQYRYKKWILSPGAANGIERRKLRQTAYLKQEISAVDVFAR